MLLQGGEVSPGLICRSEYPDGSRSFTAPNGQKKPIELRHPKRRPRTCCRRELRDPDEASRAHGEDIQKSLAATDVNLAPLCVNKQVI